MKPLIQSLLQIIDRRAARGDISYWPPRSVARLRDLVGSGELTEWSLAGAAEALADFCPAPAHTFSESSLSLRGMVEILVAFLEQSKELPSALYDRVEAVAERLCQIGGHVERLESALDGRSVTICVA